MQQKNAKQAVDKFEMIKADLDDGGSPKKAKGKAKAKGKTAANKKRGKNDDSLDDFIVSDDDKPRNKKAKTAKR